MPVEIPLSRGLVALVDDEDAETVRRYQWSALHKFLTGYTRTDHVDGNGLDNRRANLREATDLQNQRNMRKRNGTSRFKGVSWNRRDKRWVAVIRARPGRQTYLGSYTDEEAAACAYDAAARRAFGEFAALNFPTKTERSALTPPADLRGHHLVASRGCVLPPSGATTEYNSDRTAPVTAPPGH